MPYRCQHCGGVFSIEGKLQFDPGKVDSKLPGIWAYQHSFGLSKNARPLSLGEGNTPLLPARVADRDVFFKLEFLNPTGSFKDRGTAPLLAELRARNINLALEDSSGNAGASFAAYAARAEIAAKVFVPESASGPKRAQIQAYGAELAAIPGPRSAAAEAVLAAAEQGASYASHAYLPFGLAGIASIAYELIKQLGESPASIIAPAGHGSLLLGISHGFDALLAAGEISSKPRLFAVQARACAPLWAVFTNGAAGLAWMTEGETLAEGVRVFKPLRGDELMAAVQESGGSILAVEEEEIMEGRNALAKLGFYVEPTSAIVWSGLQQVLPDIPGPIVVLLTGSGLKSD